MDQPGLGKKIIELRKEQGLTQKELVDSCNLNIRTLQRIEAGEVTPRSFTLKLILETLNYEIKELPIEKEEKRNWLGKIVAFQKKPTVSFLILFLIGLILISTYYFNNSNSSELNVKNRIETSRNNITNWVNEGKIDAIMSKFSNDACISTNNICGKKRIKEVLKKNMSDGYKIIKHDIISIQSKNDIAFEKYIATYKYKGTIREQNGITEWHLSDGEWIIANELYTN